MIQVKQKHYLSGIDVRKLFFNLRHREDLSFRKAYGKCLRIIEQILDLTREIESLNRFYSKYVTTIIILFGMTGCSTLNAVLEKAGEAPFIQVTPWVVFIVVYFSFIFLFNAYSSKTIFLNVQLFKSLRQVQIKLLSKKYLNHIQMVKLDLVNEYKIFLQKCSFRLSNSAQINNKLFAFQIFGYVSVFYMKIVKENKKEGIA